MPHREASGVSGSETAGTAFAGLQGAADAFTETKAEGTGGKETYVPLSGCGSRDFCDSDSGLAIVYVHYFCKKEFARTLFCGEGTYGCQFVV